MSIDLYQLAVDSIMVDNCAVKCLGYFCDVSQMAGACGLCEVTIPAVRKRFKRVDTS